jgi:DNA-binding LytR/AlgR family response regulator
MFKLKAPKSQKARLQDILNVTDSPNYKYVLTTDKSLSEPSKINIIFNEKDTDKVIEIIDALIKKEDIMVQVFNHSGQKQVSASGIEYFIVENDEINAFVGQDKFAIKMKLYEIEELLSDKPFIRVSKFAMVNINQIDYIKPAINSKLLLLMKNGDELEVNRRYYKSFKKTLNI